MQLNSLVKLLGNISLSISIQSTINLIYFLQLKARWFTSRMPGAVQNKVGLFQNSLYVMYTVILFTVSEQ